MGKLVVMIGNFERRNVDFHVIVSGSERTYNSRAVMNCTTFTGNNSRRYYREDHIDVNIVTLIRLVYCCK